MEYPLDPTPPDSFASMDRLYYLVDDSFDGELESVVENPSSVDSKHLNRRWLGELEGAQ